MRHIILLGDDDGSVSSAVGTSLSGEFHVIQVSDIDAALSSSRVDRPALVLVTLASYDSPHAFAPVAAFKRFDPDIPVVVVAPEDDIARAQALKLGASDFVDRPFEDADLCARVVTLLRRRPRRDNNRDVAVAPPRERTYRLEHSMIFDSGARMENVRRVIDTVAHLDCTVLVRGESGTGKELVARALAAPSIQQGKPFVKVNCAALPAELLESELFGYERGAFTGAVQRKLGKFEFAHQGTIFLDEIGEMSAPMQAKILQVLQDGEFSRLGGTQDTRVDVRIIAATHRDLERMISEGQFREDLFFRLNVISITLPALRERPDSIPLIADYFLRKYSDAYKRPFAALPSTMLQQFMEYPWPGNIREMENVIQRMVILGFEASSREIMQMLSAPIVRRSLAAPTHASGPLQQQTAVQSKPPSQEPPPVDKSTAVAAKGSSGKERMASASLKDAARIAAQQVERDLILESLRRMRWNRKETAKLLGVSYKTLLAKIRENGLDDEHPDTTPLQHAG
jgi:two-component system, NtrC family, response regulator AtoC